MLLTLIKYILISLLATILFTSCTSKKYYLSKSYKKSKAYAKIKNQKIKNSKAMHRATMRSYVINGKRYYPDKTYVGEKFDGIASWYGPDFHAKLTSNGEIYDMFSSTAASKTLPMNTMVKVYNKDNGKSTIVRINDRGPFVNGRIIDLSNKAAHDIAMVKKGTANVSIKVIGFDAKIAKSAKEKAASKYSAKYYLQIGAFAKIAGAKTTKKQYTKLLGVQHKVIIKQKIINGRVLNRVLISGFRSSEEAKDFKENNGINYAIIIAH